MRRTVRTWQEILPLGDFCQALGIQEENVPCLSTMHAEVFGVSASFVRLIEGFGSEQWSQRWWSKRAFCKAAGLPGTWAGNLTNFNIDSYHETVEVRFVD